jgi:hypothetical protein
VVFQLLELFAYLTGRSIVEYIVLPSIHSASGVNLRHWAESFGQQRTH